jgi:hypothetical protein
MTCVAWRCIASGTCWLLGLNLRQRIAIATHREVVEYIIFDIMKPDDPAIVLSKLLHLSMLITLLTWLQVAPLQLHYRQHSISLLLACQSPSLKISGHGCR